KLCPHGCTIEESKKGVCGLRELRSGKLYPSNYGYVTSISLDPIEKKPLYHFKPGNSILSVGSYGCNFKCEFCQNYSISQYKSEGTRIDPSDLVDMALREKDNIGLCFTYNEPLTWYEYVYDVCEAANNTGLSMVLVTNGFIDNEPLKEILKFVDAVNIDLKAFTDDFYKKVCRGTLENVLSNIETAISMCHVELTTLLVNGLNDSPDEILKLSSWLSEINPNIPLHLSRYFPNYKMDISATPVERILSLRDLAKEKLNYVYVGNVPGVDNSTICPECGETAVRRNGFMIEVLSRDGNCPKCGNDLNLEL
ncbi:MAG TPA: AmmeMemoRadiSam system radical SAM enzyme, partial [Clostridia bacterium]